MTQQPTDTAIIDFAEYGSEDATPAIIAQLSQQAVLPRQLEEGVYAILDADGAVQIIETANMAGGEGR